MACRGPGEEGELWTIDWRRPPHQVLDRGQETHLHWQCQHGLEISQSGKTLNTGVVRSLSRPFYPKNKLGIDPATS